MKFMIKVDEIFPVDIRASIGPAGTIKRLFSNREFFKQRGYEMTIFANHSTGCNMPYHRYELREMTELPQQSNYALVSGKGRKKQLVSKIKKAIMSSKLLSLLSLKYKDQLPNELLMKSYIKRGRRPDIIVFHGFAECFHYFKHRQQDDHAKVVLFMHSDGRDISQVYKNYPRLVGTNAFETLDNKFLYDIEQIDRLVHIAKLSSKAFFELHPDYERGKVFDVVNGIDDKPIAKVAPSCNFKYRLCTSGTVNERKGQYIIIEAMKRIDEAILNDLHLTVMGVGPDFDKLVGDVKDSGLSEHVTFKGNVPNPQMHELLCAENIYCLMSNNEGLPIAIIEAMRAGLPVISTRIAGIPEEVDERNGVLIQPDIDELVGILNHLPNYDWDTLGKNSRKRFEEEFTFERMLKDYVNVFDSLR